jgi:hypothetical protein
MEKKDAALFAELEWISFAVSSNTQNTGFYFSAK